MADTKDNRAGHGGSADKRFFHDEGDGTWAVRFASALRGWNTSTLTWDRVKVDPVTGNLNVNASFSGEAKPGTATLTNVADTAVSTTLLAANSARQGAFFFNDSTVALYIKLGTTASTTSFTVKVDPQGYYELPQPNYTGRVDGIWASDASGSARITELTA